MQEAIHLLNTKSQPDQPPPSLSVRWFHAIDSPIVDPIAIRMAKREKTLSFTQTKSITSFLLVDASDTIPKKTVITHPKNWIPFSKRDNNAIEKAFQSNGAVNIVPVNEDHLFEVNIKKREISPVYWEGPVFQVRRGTWFMQGDGSKWLPCEENITKQIEEGYLKHRPHANPVTKIEPEETLFEEDVTSGANTKGQQGATKTKIPIQLVEPVEEKEYLLGPYLGQYVVYTSPVQAWLLSDTTSANIAKHFFTTISNHQNLGGIKMVRGYNQVEKEAKKKKETKKEDELEKEKEIIKQKIEAEAKELNTAHGVSINDTEGDLSIKEMYDNEMTKRQIEDYDNEGSEEEVRNIDQVVFVIHGIGQRMSERMGQNFVHDVNLFRKTIKSTWPIVTAIDGTGSNTSESRSNGIQVLPILWRNAVVFGTDDKEDSDGLESDLGMPDKDDGCPTLEEITIDGAPSIRTLVADVFLDIPLYLTSKYHDQMIHEVSKQVNHVYKLFIERNPHFLKNNGQVTILAHSLGSLLAFDILSAQPLTATQKTNASNLAPITEKKIATPLSFPVKNFFAVGSPLGMLMLLRGHKILSRKYLDGQQQQQQYIHTTATSNAASDTNNVSFVYPAVDSIYNIFHKSDPVAYRLEPLIARRYGAILKPTPITYIKGGLKSVLDAGFNVGNDIAIKAGVMFELFKSGLTSNVLMRGLGFSATETIVKEEETCPDTQHKQSHPNPELNISRAEVNSIHKLKQLNPNNGRIDFYLQEGLLENAYISALSVHMSYWQDVDVAGFLIREIYKNQEETKLPV